MKLLLIDDSERLRRSLTTGLRHTGFAVDVAGDGEEGLGLALGGAYDVVVLDLMLPRLDGLSVLRRLREAGNRVHVLILSAKNELDERIEGLEAGADDYLVKPFEFDELVARLRALVRRKSGVKNPLRDVAGLRIDTNRRTVHHGDLAVPLTPNEYAILDHLVAHRGRVVSKRELLAQLYEDTRQGSENAVEVFVHQLRRKLLAAGAADPVRTRRGLGYLVD